MAGNKNAEPLRLFCVFLLLFLLALLLQALGCLFLFVLLGDESFCHGLIIMIYSILTFSPRVCPGDDKNNFKDLKKQLFLKNTVWYFPDNLLQWLKILCLQKAVVHILLAMIYQIKYL